jgi:hypothetical protein
MKDLLLIAVSLTSLWQETIDDKTLLHPPDTIPTPPY